MKTRSAKNKGKRLQNWVRDKLVSTALQTAYVDLSRDIKSTTMGESGTDVQLTGDAAKYYDLAIECKSRKSFKTLYDMYHQADSYEGDNVLFIKQDRSKPLAVIDAEWFIKLIQA